MRRGFMGRSYLSVGGGLRLAACAALAGAVFAATASPATAARNEARWYQQNYCMVKAYKALGKHDFATYEKNARQRPEERRVGNECVRRCRSRGWPDH